MPEQGSHSGAPGVRDAGRAQETRNPPRAERLRPSRADRGSSGDMVVARVAGWSGAEPRTGPSVRHFLLARFVHKILGSEYSRLAAADL